MLSNEIADLSYDAAMRALDLQERAVEQLRTRAGMLLTASWLAASFLGAETIQRGRELGPLVALALTALMFSVVLCVYVLLPKRGLAFGLRAVDIYSRLVEIGGNNDEVRRRLVYWLDRFWERNQRQLDGLDRCYVGAALALIVQLALWSAALLSTIHYR